MRKVIASTFISLDGVMQAPGGPDEDRSGGFAYGGWVAPYWDEVTDAAVSAIFARPYQLLLGRRTYDIFAAFWPHVEQGPDADLAQNFNTTTKYVATSSTAPLDWAHSVALHDPVADVARLKAQDGPDLVIQGSGVLIRSLLSNGLIDALTLLVFPVVLGSGKRLFGDVVAPSALRLTGSEQSPSGVVISSYVPAGEVETGSFA